MQTYLLSFWRLPSRLAAAVAIAGLLVAGGACSRSATTALNPSPTKCQVTASAPADPVGPGGGTTTVSIAAQPECTWSASAEGGWISGLTPPEGQGPGSVAFQVGANPSSSTREAAIVLNGQKVMVRQQGAACRFDVTPRTRAVDAQSGVASVTVESLAGCPWSASTGSDWITITSGGTGSSSGAVTYRYDANTGAARSATLSVAGVLVSISQAAAAGPDCQFTVSPTTLSVTATATTATTSVAAPNGCAWTVVSNDPWISAASDPKTGAGSVLLSISANPGAARSTTVIVAGRTVAVEQAGSCTLSFSPASLSIAAAGGPFTASVTAPDGCPWNPVSRDEWLVLTSGASGSGSGPLFVLAQANVGPARIGTVSIGGQVFTVNQAGGCASSINPTTQSLATPGGPGSAISVSLPAGCAWTAASNAFWITLNSGATGSGNGSVTFTAGGNPGPSRTGTIAIAGQTFTLTQAGGCATSINPTSQSVGSNAGAGSAISVTAPDGCGWTTTSNDAWIAVTTGASGSGNAAVGFSVSANSGPARSGTLAVAGQTFTVTQAANCGVSINPTSQSLGSGATTGTAIAVTAPPGCGWTAGSNAAWITVTSGASGTGSGSVGFAAAANTGAARTGTLTVGAQTFTVSQAGNCSSSINPTSQPMGSGAGTGTTIAVTAPAGCGWTTTSNDGWITVTSGATGSGNGPVGFSVAANSGPSRTGTITVAGQTFTVNQTGNCSSSINPTTQSIGSGAAAGNGVAVTAPAGCGWTATSNSSWITVTSGATGSGNGSVGFSVTANTGPSRTGTITVAGHTFTVNQAGNCSSSINPTTQSFGNGAAAGNGVAVTAPAGCGWTATSNDSWITVTSGASGSGSGTVQFSVAANSSPSRSGTLTIAGQTFTVNQNAGCTFGINPTSQNVAATAGTGSSVSVTSSCAWTTTSNASWLTITTGANGTGNGSVGFTFAANSGPVRSGTLTIAGQTFTVNQAGGCTYGVAPLSQSFAQGGGNGGPVSVTATAGCTWSATTTDSWITVKTGASGNGNGSVTFSVASNPGAPRTGSLTVAGRTFAVSQTGTCSFAVSPLSVSNLDSGGQAGPDINVTTAAGCAWTAVSNDSWITLTAGTSGTGNGTVRFTVAVNPGGARTGSITVAGQTVTIKQVKH